MKETIEIGSAWITQERSEQIHKHGRTIEDDIKFNTNDQLVDAAIRLLDIDPDIGSLDSRPFTWNPEIWDKMYNKPYIERLVIAGALIAAEIDRYVNNIEVYEVEKT